MDGALARIELLGPFTVRGPTGDDRVGGGLAAALLALLAVRPGVPIERDDLIAALWPSTDVPNAGPALRQLLTRCRRVLPIHAIQRVEVAGRTAYLLSSERVAVDLAEFDRLADDVRGVGGVDERMLDEALALVTGRPFSGLPELVAFDDVRRVTEMRIVELRRWRLIADAERCRPSLLPALDAALEVSPDDEALWTAKVRYLARTARPAAGARAAAAARRALTEVGIEPGPGLRSAEQLTLGLGSMSPLVDVPLPPARDLVGRVGPRAEVVTAVLDGRTPLVTTWGAPGMGVSSLVLAVANDVQRAGRRVAYVTLPTPRARTSARVLVDDIAGRLGWTSQDGDPVRWMSVVAATDAVLVLDLPAPRRTVGEVVRILTTGWPGPVVVAATRPTGHVGEHAVCIGPLAPDDAVQLLRLRAESLRGRPLPEEDLRALAEICARSGGIPLVLELVAHQLTSCSVADLLAGPMAPGLTDRVDDAIARLSPSERDLLHRLAWIDVSFDLVDALRMHPRPRPSITAVREMMQALIEVGLVQFEAGRSTDPYHVLEPIATEVRARDEAICVRSSAMRRRAVTLAARGRCWSAEIGTPAEPLARTMLTGRLPELLGTPHDRTLPTAVRTSLVRCCVELLATLGRASEARQLLDRVVVTDADFEHHVVQLAGTAYATDDFAAVVELDRRARGFPMSAADRRAVSGLAVRSLRAMCRFDEAHRLLDELDATLSPDHEVDAPASRMERGMVLLFEDRRDEARELLAEARIDFHELGIVRAAGACDVYSSWCACVQGAHDRAAELLQRAWDVAIRLGHAADEMFCASTAARLAVERRRYDLALEHGRTAEAAARASGDRLLLARVLESRSAAERGLGGTGEEAAFEAALLRRRISAPISPFERRWTDGERLLTIAGR